MAKFTDGKEKYLAKIKALRDTAETLTKNGDMEAAETFLKKANELLLEYNLNEADMRAHGENIGNPFAEWGYSERVSYKENLAGNRWRMDLIKMIASHNLVGVLFTNIDEKYTFQIYGDIQNVEQVVWLYNYLSTYLIRLAKQYTYNLPAEDKKEYCRHTHMKSYLDGAIIGISYKLNEQNMKSEHAKQIHDLVIFNDKSLDTFLHKTKKVKTTKPRESNIMADDAYIQGVIDGKKIDPSGKRLSNAEEKVKSKLLK